MTAPQLVPAQGTTCAWCRGGIEADEPRVIVRDTFIVCGPSCAKYLEARLVRSGATQHHQQHPQQSASRPDPLALAIAQRLADLAKPAPPAAAPSSRFGLWAVRRTLAAAFGKDVTIPPTARPRRWREEDC